MTGATETEPMRIQIINAPLDLGASRRGTDAGPSGFRIAGLHGAIERLGHTVLPDIDIVVPTATSADPGSARARFRTEILAVCKELAERTRDALEAGTLPLVIGGDHSISMGSVSGAADHFRRRGEPLGVIWFDAHGDMNLPETSPSGNVHGMPLAHLLGHGDPELAGLLGHSPALRPENVVLVGLRDIDRKERDFINASGVTAFTMRDIDQLGMVEVSSRAREIASRNTAGYHLSFDLDGCDPAVIPGSGTLVPGGVNLREAHLFLEDCALDGGMTSMDVVELNPFIDHANISAERAVVFVQSALGRQIL